MRLFCVVLATSAGFMRLFVRPLSMGFNSVGCYKAFC